MRRLYSFIFYAITPLIIFRLWWRSLKNPDYSKPWLERFGIYSEAYIQNVIWFHAVSVGEVEALYPLVELFLNRHPEIPILITTTTPTGSACVKKKLQNRVAHVYLPYDLPLVIHQFMKTFKPIKTVIMETEIWPNLYNYCGHAKIPLYLINARLSEKSARGYQKAAALFKSSLQNLAICAVQTKNDADRFVKIGVLPDKIINMGNMKFDVAISDEMISEAISLKQALFPDRFVLVAASTHEGEEVIFIELFEELQLAISNITLLIAPRHPERFNEVKELAQKKGLSVSRRTGPKIKDVTSDVYLLDTLGELKLFYGAADIAFVGGSLVPVGGHNVLEPAAMGVPVLFGHHMDNFLTIANEMLTAEAAIQCSAQTLKTTLLNLYHNKELSALLVENARVFVKQNKGATEHIYKVLNG
jgi:3-deoxy-D-manno-octulosonic-acid transferase